MEKIDVQSEYLFNRLAKRYRHLKKWAGRTGTNAYRLYDRDIPEIPLVLDLYGDAVSGALYKRPYLKDEQDQGAFIAEEENLRYTEDWIKAMKASIGRVLEIPEGKIFLKERQRMRRRQEEGIQYGRISTLGFYRDVREGDIGYRVNLSDYLDTGLYLDARKKRALIRGESAGKKVLNLFAYTCTLSAAAAKGGAKQVDSVDLSNTYLEWGKINLALNGFSPEITSGNDFAFNSGADTCRLVRSDVLQFLRNAKNAGAKWDIVILDPPAFSNSKKMRSVLDTRRDHRNLIQSCLSLLSPGGTLWFSSNARGFSLEAGDFPGYILKDMRKELLDEDFRGKTIPLCYTITHNSREAN